MLLDTYDGEGFEEVIPGKTLVVLVGNHYTPCPEEPAWGSTYGCKGIVSKFWGERGEYDVEVEWDNGRTNPYRIGDLRSAPLNTDKESKNNPNYTFIAKKKALNRLKWTKETQI